VQEGVEGGFVQIVLKAWSSDPHYSGGCDYAVVEVGEVFLKLALRRIRVLCEQRILDSSLSETYYWDSSVQYFSPWLNRASKSGAALEAVIAEADFGVPESQIGAVECSQMIVRDGGIAFNALIKHSDTYVTTAEISKQMIESALSSATD
jgi:hypothetical protein